jgi:hypothetical protein
MKHTTTYYPMIQQKRQRAYWQNRKHAVNDHPQILCAASQQKKKTLTAEIKNTSNNYM